MRMRGEEGEDSDSPIMVRAALEVWMRSVPRGWSPSSPTAAAAERTSSSAGRTRTYSRSPASVRCTLRVVRRTSATPRRVSRRRNA